MSLIDQAHLALDGVFRDRVRVAMIQAAESVQAESTGTANDTNRSNYAKSILNNPDAYVSAFSSAVAADPNNAGITSASSDSDIQFTVNAVFNALAGRI